MSIFVYKYTHLQIYNNFNIAITQYYTILQFIIAATFSMVSKKQF